MSLISWYKNESSEVENRKARRAFETVLIVAVKQPDTERYRHFSTQVNALQAGMNNDSTLTDKLVRSILPNERCSSFECVGQSHCCDILRCCFTLCLWIESND